VTGQPGNGQFDPADDDQPDDDAPLDTAEQAAADAEALAEADESLDERIEAVVEDLDGVERRREGEMVTYLAGGRPFAVLLPDVLEVALEGTVGKAALKTGDTQASSRGAGWIAFTPEAIDRFALDRAEAWLRSAHRRATGG
jgi:FAD/FMN-containing dehydrogenase